MLRCLYEWFDTSEINARIAESYGELENKYGISNDNIIDVEKAVNNLQLVKDIKELKNIINIDNRSLHFPLRKYNKETDEYDITGYCDISEDVLANAKQFFKKTSILKYSNEKFYNYFCNYIISLEPEIIKRIEKVVKLYNDTILHAVYDAKKDEEKTLDENYSFRANPYFCQLENYVLNNPLYKIEDLFF